jgi:hypothetical protein
MLHQFEIQLFDVRLFEVQSVNQLGEVHSSSNVRCTREVGIERVLH